MFTLKNPCIHLIVCYYVMQGKYIKYKFLEQGVVSTLTVVFHRLRTEKCFSQIQLGV